MAPLRDSVAIAATGPRPFLVDGVSGPWMSKLASAGRWWPRPTRRSACWRHYLRPQAACGPPGILHPAPLLRLKLRRPGWPRVCEATSRHGCGLEQPGLVLIDEASDWGWPAAEIALQGAHSLCHPPGVCGCIRPSLPPVGAPSSPVFEIARAHRCALRRGWLLAAQGRECFGSPLACASKRCLAGSRPCFGDAPAGRGWWRCWQRRPGWSGPGALRRAAKCDNHRSGPESSGHHRFAEQLVALARRASMRHGLISCRCARRKCCSPAGRYDRHRLPQQ